MPIPVIVLQNTAYVWAISHRYAVDLPYGTVAVNTGHRTCEALKVWATSCQVHPYQEMQRLL